jgi:hypothetical protein
MASSKVTFTLDAATIHRLRDAAERLAKPQSAVVREAIQDFHERIGKLSESERTHLLLTFDHLVPTIPSRPLTAVKKELTALRQARRAGGRKILVNQDR